MNLVAGFLKFDDPYAGEWAVACPTCGAGESHIAEAGTLLGRDPHESGVYTGTSVLGMTSSRRSAISVVFDGECGHRWEVKIQQHKGVNLVTVQVLTAMDPEQEA